MSHCQVRSRTKRAICFAALAGLKRQRQTAKSLDQSPAWQTDQLYSVVQDGWHKADPAKGAFLDFLFQGEWPNEARGASRLPPGMLLDPRHAGSIDLNHPALGPVQCDGSRRRRAPDLQRGAIREIRIGASGNIAGALAAGDEQLPINVYWYGYRMESYAFTAFGHWLHKAGPDKALLQECSPCCGGTSRLAPIPPTRSAQYLMQLENGTPTSSSKRRG